MGNTPLSRLGQLIECAQSLAIRYGEHGEGRYRAARRHHLEGVASRLADSACRSRRITRAARPAPGREA